MPIESVAADALIESAGGNFYLILLAVLAGGGLYFANKMFNALITSYISALNKIADDNNKSNERTHALIADGMLEIVTAIKEYKCDTVTKFKEHDDQAKRIGMTVERIDVKIDHALKSDR